MLTMKKELHGFLFLCTHVVGVLLNHTVRVVFNAPYLERERDYSMHILFPFKQHRNS